MKSIFKKITALGLFSFVLLGVGFNVNASGGGSSGGSSSTSSSVKISAPVFNTGWVINGQVKRVCWGLPEHAIWNTGSVNGTTIKSVYGDLMEITVPLTPSALLGVLTHRADPTRCPIICDDGYSYNSTTKNCDKTSTQPTQPTENNGDIALFNDANMDKAVFAAPYASNIVIASGTLRVPEPIKLSGIQLTGTTIHGSGVANIIKNVKFRINGDIYNASETCTTNGCSYVTDSNEIIVNNTTNITVLVDIKADAPESAIVKFSNLTYQSLEGQVSIISNNELINKYNIPGSIITANVVIKASKLNITNNQSATQKVAIGNTDTVTIFDGKITATNSKISVNELILEKSNSSTLNITNDNQITLTLYIDGEIYTDELFKTTSTSAIFENLGDIPDGKSMEIKITAQPEISNSTGYIDFKVSAAGTDSRGNDIESNKVSAARLQIVDPATASIATTNASSTAILDGANTELLTFTATVKDGSYDLTGVTVVLSSAVASLENHAITLEIDGSAVVSVTYNGTDTKFDLQDLNESLTVGKHSFVIKANVNVGDSGSAIVDIKSVQLNSDTPKTMSVRKLITEAYPVISLVSIDSNSNEMILKITNPIGGSENIVISGFIFNDGDNIGTLALNGQVLGEPYNSIYSIDENKQVTLASGESTDFIVNVSKNTAQLNGIIVNVNGHDVVFTNEYTNLATWSNLKITYKH